MNAMVQEETGLNQEEAKVLEDPQRMIEVKEETGLNQEEAKVLEDPQRMIEVLTKKLNLYKYTDDQKRIKRIGRPKCTLGCESHVKLRIHK